MSTQSIDFCSLHQPVLVMDHQHLSWVEQMNHVSELLLWSINNVRFETDPHSPPRHVEMFNIGQRCAHLSWIPPVFQDQNGPLSYYEIQFLQTQFDTIPTIVVHTTNLSISCCGLEEYTNYSVTVAAATNSGLGPFSSPVSLITHEDGIFIQLRVMDYVLY